ncbi:MFS general substrate transporter [Microthyrium microscopicum]|uniref:MFS general substrate transporter n=1 Tax=Microthyrium microscopicum TaxID=703497 RepID=A0A6A6UAB6_9PEZI|nr:MFS general substrate transporter [Microthyrium microscopicum]
MPSRDSPAAGLQLHRLPSHGDSNTTNGLESTEMDRIYQDPPLKRDDRDNDELDRRTVRKLDRVLLPFLALLFLFNSLDRSNIGNAETADFTKDIGLEPEDLNTAVAIFFVFFVALQPLGAALGRKYGMARYVPFCMTIWGVCTAMHVWVRAKWQLIALRIIIGSLEAGFYPTTVSYLSLFYTEHEFGRRLALFYGQYAMAGALGGILSYAVFAYFPISSGGSPNEDGLRPWQVLFLLEGGVTICLAITGFFWLPHNAKTAWFLKADERVWAEERIQKDRAKKTLAQSTNPAHAQEDEEDGPGPELDETRNLLGEQSGQGIAKSSKRLPTDDRGLSRQDIVEALLDWKLWYLLFCNILSAIPVTAFGIFLPLVLKSLSDSPAHTNLLTAPPFLIGAVVLYAFTHWSDISRRRIQPILWSLGLLLVGLVGVVLLPSSASILRYLALCVLLSGTFVASPLTIAWFAGNMPETGKRSVVLGINGWGNLAGVFASLIFQPRFGPTYATPFFITLALVAVAFIGYAYFGRMLLEVNNARKAQVGEWSHSEIEDEVKYGRGPIPDARARWVITLARRVVGEAHARRLTDFLHLEGRRGDDKMTFQYGL